MHNVYDFLIGRVITVVSKSVEVRLWQTDLLKIGFTAHPHKTHNSDDQTPVPDNTGRTRTAGELC